MNPLSIMIVLLLLLLAIKVPVAIAMGFSTLIYLLITNASLSLIPQYLIINLNSFTLLAIPFFLLTGELMNRAGISERIFNFTGVLIGHIRGGLAHVNVVANMIMAGMSGVGTSDAAMTSRVLVPIMEKQGYSRPYAAALTAASATIGPIIPPSVPMVLLASICELSVGRLFLGGIIPGFLMGGGLMVIIALQSRKYNFPKSERATFPQIVDAVKKAFLPLLTPVIILGGMLSGFFTPTEAAVVAVMYSLLLGFVIYRTLHWVDLLDSLLVTAKISARILYIVALASVFGWVLTTEQVTNSLSHYMVKTVSSPYLILLYLNLLLLFLGCFINLTPLVIICAPIFFPLIKQFGIDPIHFGVVMILNLMIGQLTPPVGLLLFVVMGVTNVKLKDVLKPLMPFIFVLFIVLMLITYIDQLVLVIPDLMMGKRAF
jgi:tripartite ATP-independent transporter DctM subunit